MRISYVTESFSRDVNGVAPTALRVAEQLASPGHEPLPPDPEPADQPPAPLAQWGWLATKGTAWIMRRSTDLVPYLLAMAVRKLCRRPQLGDQPQPASSGLAREEGLGGVVDLAAYRWLRRSVRDADLTRNAPPPR